MKIRSIGTLLIGMTIILISWYAGYLLPVKEVWFGHQESTKAYPLATVKDWEDKIQSMDWVDSYRMRWVYPSSLALELDVKSPQAVLVSGEYVAMDASLFHMPNQMVDVPALDVDKGHIIDALTLVRYFELYDSVKHIQEFSSGAVKVKVSSGMTFVLPSMQFHKAIPPLLSMYKGQQKHCNLVHNKYASCY